MLFDALGALTPLLADASSSATIKAALLGGVALVLAAVLPVIVSRREHEPKAVRDLRKAEHELREEIEADRDQWKNTAQQAIQGTRVRDVLIDQLRRQVVSLGGTPFDWQIPDAPDEPTREEAND